LYVQNNGKKSQSLEIILFGISERPFPIPLKHFQKLLDDAGIGDDDAMFSIAI
jgi:hypothetical protein